jgi:hypothetical protein
MWTFSLDRLHGGRAARVQHRKPHRRFTPRVQVLEGRTLPSTLTVLNNQDSGPGSLRDTIATAASGDTIDFDPGLAGQTITLMSGQLLLNKSLDIEGPGADQLTISGNHASRVFQVASNTTVSIAGLTMANGYFRTFGDAGAGILNQGTLTLSNSTVANNRADGSESAWGGGIVNRGTLAVLNSAVTGNVTATVSGGGGAGIENYGTLMVVNSNVSNNNGGGGFGGGIQNAGGTVTISGSTLTANVCTSFAGIYNQSGMVTITDSTLSGNMAGFSAGGISNEAMMAIDDSTITGNSAEDGGGGILNDGTLTITNSTIAGNSNNFSSRGGGIWNDGSLSLHNSILAGNTDSGGAPDLYGNLDSSGYNLIGNTSGGSGYTGTDLLNVNPVLGPLQDSGGPTQTMGLLPGSPALNAGDPAQLGVADQRGVVRTGGVNIGAYQASATAFVLTALDTATSGVPFDVTVTAVDPFGQVALGYIGTVTFSTTDPDHGVVLPADYTFTSADQGSVTFSSGVTLITPGVQALTATDAADSTITGSATVTVTTGGDRPALDGLRQARACAADGFIAVFAEPTRHGSWSLGRSGWLSCARESADGMS